jgi:hypothetical protein
MMSAQPAASKSPFPVELLSQIFPDLSPHDLCSVARVNSVFYAVVVPLLYRDIVLYYAERNSKSPGRGDMIQQVAGQKSCLTILCEVDHLASLVRTIDIDWSESHQFDSELCH